MDMDFLSDPIFSDLDRSDFIGGIDNEAIDFGHLEQFMQVEASVGNIDECNNCHNTNGNNNHNHNISNSNNREGALACDSKAESNTAAQQQINAAEANISLATVSARVSLATTPIATPLPAVVGHGTPHMPDSPPDSGSEPPYSPLQDMHGLTLTSRDVYNGLSAIHQATALQELHMQSQFTPPHHHQHHQQQQQQHNQLHFAHSLNNSAAHDNGADGVRVKHEAGLIMDSASLAQQLPQHANALGPNHDQHGTPLELPSHQLMYTNINANAMMQYDGIYPATSYQNIGLVASMDQVPTPTCILTSMPDAPRVQVVGTSQANPAQSNRASLPTTPVHPSSSRKRKLSTQIDCSDYANIKPDPGLTMSPSGSAPSGAVSTEPQNLGPTSPVSINLSTHNNDMSSTPAHSVASLSPALSTVNSNPDTSLDGNNAASGGSGENSEGGALTPSIRFSPFQPQNWHKLCDQSLQDIAVVYYRVDADKGFNFSISDDAFVCQKKNHFQITCHARLQGDAKFVKTPSGLEKINSFHLHFYGVKSEAPNQTIRVEQSQSDRSKKPFYPVPIDLQSHIVSKITVGRLHFSETTNNNMRKKGRPNPEQRYFQLVVGLHVHTISGNFPIISQGSERIIVRASNPGQFESDVDLCWQRGLTQDSIFHAGRVGINTDRPDESLVVHGNLKVSGHIVQPSDSRAKQEIGELDTSVQLRNLQKIRIVRYRYEPEFAIHSGLKRASESDSEDIVDTGVIAQEVREVIPDAVQEAGSIVLPNGNVIENFLLVNKDRILMENIGAVKELCKVTGSLETRIEDLERNNRLVRTRDFEQRSKLYRGGKNGAVRSGYEICSNKSLQMVIFLLVIVMAACLAAVSTLYFVEHNKQHYNYKQLERLQFHSNGHVFGRDSVLISEQEGYIVQVHNILNKNKTLQHASTPHPPGYRNSSRSRPELSYDDSGELYTAHGHNDELTVVMEKPLVSLQPLLARAKEPPRITTSAPLLRINKTISSKNKSKWPQAQVVPKLIASFQSSRTTHAHLDGSGNLNFVPPIATVHEPKVEESANASETSSEKVADSIPLSHDFDNNSIDVDAQHVTKKALAARGSASRHATSNEATVVENGNTNSDVIASTSSSSSNNHVPDTTATAYSFRSNNNAYRTVSPPSAILALTTNQVASGVGQANYSLEAPPISNKSQGVLEATVDNADALDLQNLSNNNESADNPTTALFGSDFVGHESALGRRSTSQRSVELVVSKTTQLEIIGAPVQCTQKPPSDDVSNCQSYCFEESNQLLPLLPRNLPSLTDAQHANEKLNEQPLEQQQIVEFVAEDNADDAAADGQLEGGRVKSAAAPPDAANATGTAADKKSLASQISIERQSEDAETLESLLERSSLSDENLDLNAKAVDGKSLAESASPSIDANRPPASDCWLMSSCVLADSLNETFGLEYFCPNNGRSLNLTYIIPLSRFFKESSIELHLRSSVSLVWTICNDHEHTKHQGKHLLNTSAHQLSANVLQKRQGTSILYLNIPSRGYFVRNLSLRATSDLKKQNICQETAHEANTLLQYNFSIVRDCD